MILGRTNRAFTIENILPLIHEFILFIYGILIIIIIIYKNLNGFLY